MERVEALDLDIFSGPLAAGTWFEFRPASQNLLPFCRN